jgi:hypothetical protein
MPVEFSGAAYRFGHSMVRPDYRLSLKDLKPSTTRVRGLNGRKLVFAPDPLDGLNGFREFPSDFGIDWNLFFETQGRRLSPRGMQKDRIQPAYKIDTSLVAPLGALPEFSKPGTDQPRSPRDPNVLALRNLLRGVALGLPSGQDVARLMGVAPIPDDELLVGKATVDGLKESRPIAFQRPGFARNAPLWFYCLAEAAHLWALDAARKQTDEKKNTTPTHLGPVGGRIVSEVFVGLLVGDAHSFLSQAPRFEPLLGNPKAKSIFDRFTMGDLAAFVTAQ